MQPPQVLSIDFDAETRTAMSWIVPGAVCFAIGAVGASVAMSVVALQPVDASIGYGIYLASQIFQWGLGFPCLVTGLVRLSRIPPDRRWLPYKG